MSIQIGIIGVGNLAGYLVEGFCSVSEPATVTLSPRNAEQAYKLASRFDCRIADSNAEVVNRSQVVILSTRPSQVAGAAKGLPWESRHTVICVAVGVPLVELTGLITPARLVRAMPVTSAAIGKSPTSIFPEDDIARSIFSTVGTVIALPDEQSFDVAGITGAFYAWLFALAREATEWMSQNGVPESTARSLTAGALTGAGGVIGSSPGKSLTEIFAALTTPGGITEAGVAHLDKKGALKAWQEACETALIHSRHRLR